MADLFFVLIEALCHFTWRLALGAMAAGLGALLMTSSWPLACGAALLGGLAGGLLDANAASRTSAAQVSDEVSGK